MTVLCMQKLQLVQGIEAEKDRRITLETYISKVELLQTAVTSVADAVLQELDELAAERNHLKEEKAAWVSTVRNLEGAVQCKLSQLGQMEDRLDVKLKVAAELPGQLGMALRQQRAADTQLEGLKAEVKLLHAQLHKLERSQALATSEAAAAPLNHTQRSQVKEYAHDAVRETIPGLLAASISSHVPAMIDEVVEQRSSELRASFTSTADVLAGDIGRLAKEGAAVRADVSAVAGLVKRTEADLGGLATRLGRLEATEVSNPKASVRLVSALEDKMDNLAAVQGRQAKSVEGVVAALVEDTMGLSKATRHLENVVSMHQNQLQDTKEALLRQVKHMPPRSAQVFSQVLKVPSPVSSALWSAGGSPMRGAYGSLAAGLPGSPARQPATAAGSPLSSKYSALLASL
eukprot:gene13626-13752_t